MRRSVRDLRLDMEAECIEHLPEEVLMAHADGLLDAEQRALAGMHLEDCPACRAELDELCDLKKTLDTGR
ncbi:MAG TPA: zf-HC2 domain-containing protein [Thermoanaerobaculia bacterium]|nr:zf-HC2 domain-containing protein [Thermoanaerobaculia bacterium]